MIVWLCDGIVVLHDTLEYGLKHSAGVPLIEEPD